LRIKENKNKNKIKVAEEKKIIYFIIKREKSPMQKCFLILLFPKLFVIMIKKIILLKSTRSNKFLVQ